MSGTARSAPRLPASIAERVAQLEVELKAEVAASRLLAVEVAALRAIVIAEHHPANRRPLESCGGAGNDGAPFPPGNWKRIKAAAAESGYSEGGIWGMIRREDLITVRRGGRVYVDLDRIPREKRKRKNVLRFLRGEPMVPAMKRIDPLRSFRRKVGAAEAALLSARAAMRAAAELAGVETAGLFEDTQFILRESGEQWVRDARRQGEDKGFASAMQGLKLLVEKGCLRAVEVRPILPAPRGASS